MSFTLQVVYWVVVRLQPNVRGGQTKQVSDVHPGHDGQRGHSGQLRVPQG